MHKGGLAALAETYGPQRAELQRLMLIAEGFFSDLREELARCVGSPIQFADPAQSTTTFEQLRAGTAPHQLVLIGSDGGTAAVIMVDRAFACALVDCVIAGGAASPPEVDRKLTMVEEHLLSNTLRTACLASARRTLAALPDRHIEPHLMRAQRGPRDGASVFEPSAQLAITRVTCNMARGHGSIEIGFPSPRVAGTKTHLPPRHASAPSPAAARQQLRAALADSRAELTAILGQLRMPLAAVRALGPGSILMLRNMQSGVPNVELRCQDQALFSGAVVEHRGWRRFLIQRTGGCDERTEQRRFGA